MKSRPLLIALAAHAVLLLCVMPASPWEFDEPLFFQGLHRYDPLAHHPPPPGYPLFMLFGQVVRWLVPDDFATLVAISLAGSLAGFALLALAFRNMTGDLATGIAGAMFFYWSPAMLIHSTLPISEPGALALLAAALYFGTRNAPAAFAAFAAMAIGWRIQFSIFVVPLFLVQVALMRSWRNRLVALAVFTAVCLAWLAPLTIAVGGVDELIAFETGQGKYLVAHDAAESRTGWTPARIAFRFIGRAWGTEWMALPMLALAAFGLFRLGRIPPVVLAAAVYIGVALWAMDPADGVRYAIPFILTTALLAGVGATAIARRLSLSPYAVPVAAAVGFAIYTAPLLIQRRLTPSPPVHAAEVARSAFPQDAVALYELPLWPHAMYYLADRHPIRVDDGLARFWNRPDVPLFIYADGASTRAGARVFSWKPSDAYTKLTRNHYRVVSIIPLPPEGRFRIAQGVYGPERDPQGREWRWLSEAAELQLPAGPPRMLALRLGLPAESPLEANDVTVLVNGQPAARVRVERGKAVDVRVSAPAGAPLIRLQSEETFVPADVPALRSGDRRRLAVELYDLRTSTASALPSRASAP